MALTTTGIGIHAALTLETDPSHVLSLSLSGTNTHQLVPTLKDVAGTTQSATQPFKYISRNPSVATVNATGLITAVKRGCAIIEAAYPFANNTGGNNSDGLPVTKIYNEVHVTIGV